MKQKKIFGFDYTYNEYMKIFMYLLVGGSAALLEWGLFFVFFSVLTHVGIFSLQTQTVLAATTLAFATSTLYHYFLCNRFVFDSGSRYHKGTEVSLVFFSQCCWTRVEFAADVDFYFSYAAGTQSDAF